MAQSSWPSPDTARVVNDSQYEKMAINLGPRAGLFGLPTQTDLVYGDSTGLQVKIRADRYATVRGYEWWSGSTEFTKTISANSSGSTRIDLVVLRLSRTTWNVTVEVINGTPGSGSAPAATQNTGTTGVWELPIATVTVANSASTITAGNVTPINLYLGGDGSGYVINTGAGSATTAVLAWVPSPHSGQIVTNAGEEGKTYVYTGSAWRSTTPDIQKFTISGTWTRPAGAKWVRFRGRACGGAGGSAPSTSAGQTAKGGGGGEGGYSERTLAASAVTSSVTITIGTAGAPVAGNTGGNGGNVSAGSYMSANGGLGGPRAAASAVSFGVTGGAGGTPTGAVGDLTLGGAPGGGGYSEAGLGFSGQGGGAGGGAGRDSPSTGTSITGVNGVDGGGGGGGISMGAGAALGGTGGPGWVIVETYF